MQHWMKQQCLLYAGQPVCSTSSRRVRGSSPGTHHTAPRHKPWAENRAMTLKQACCQECPNSARCVQRSVDSRNSAIHNAYHTSLRSSSVLEPRHPSLKVVRATSDKFQQHQEVADQHNWVKPVARMSRCTKTPEIQMLPRALHEAAASPRPQCGSRFSGSLSGIEP